MDIDEDMDDLVDCWHETETLQSIHEFLGLTEVEYHEWVKSGTLPLDYQPPIYKLPVYKIVKNLF